MKQITGIVFSNRKITADYYLLWLEAPEIAAEARPGQFVMVRCSGDTVLPRPFSLHRRNGGRIALLYQQVGTGTAWLAGREAGDRVEVFGPLGNGYTLDGESRNIMLVAGGIGIAPLCFLADEAAGRGCAVKMLAGAGLSANLELEDSFPPGMDFIYASEDGLKGRQGLVTALIADYYDRTDRIFACGPLAMYRSMAAIPELAGMPVQVSLEVRMGCGLGVCYGCTVRTSRGLKQVCRDGPVFGLHEIDWDHLKLM